MFWRDPRRSFSAGELAPGLAMAQDLDLYRTGLKRARNILVHPTGGFTDRGGFRHIAHVRNRLVSISLDDAVITPAAGGSEVVDFDPETGEAIIIITDPVVPAGGGAIVHVDFGEATEVGLVDVTNLSISGADAQNSWRVEYSTDNSNWTPFQPGGVDPTGEAAFDAYGSPTSRRAALAPGESVTARYWRVFAKSSIAGRTVQIPALTFWRENANLSNVKAFNVAFDVDAQYCMIVSDRTLEVYSDGARVVSVAAPHTHAQIPDITEAQSLDTLLLFHPDVPPHRVFRVRGDAEWDSRAQVFENIPRVQFPGETYTNGVNEKQGVTTAVFNNNDQFTLAFRGERTDPITWAGDNSTTAGNIQTALRALSNVGSGGCTVTREGINYWVVEFTGDLGQKPHPVMTFSYIGPGDGNEFMSVERVRQGEEGGEALFSATRGWPACGRFYQERLALAGFRSRPASVAFSALGAFFDFDITIEEFDGAIVQGIGDDQMKRIRRLWNRTRLEIFTDDSEYFTDTTAISKGEVIPFTRASGRGVLAGAPVVEADDITLFVQADGKALRGYVYDDRAQSYLSPNVSRLCPHLINSPVSGAAKRSDGPEGADLVFLANADGSAAVLAILQAEEFTPFHSWDTAGDSFIAFGHEGRSNIYAVTERDGSRRVEIYDEDCLYDAAYVREGGSPINQVTGLDWLEGRTVELWLDGRPYGEAEVDGGAVSLPVSASRIEIGLPFTVEAELMPGSTGGGDLSVFDRYLRHYEVSVSIIATGALAVAANGQPARAIPLRSYGPSALKPVDEALFTGEVRVKGLAGVKRNSTVTITQGFRAPLRVAGVVLNTRSTQ